MTLGNHWANSALIQISRYTLLVLIIIFLHSFNFVRAVELHFSQTDSITNIQDAVLFTSNSGSCQYETVAIGSLDLSKTDFQYELNLRDSVDSAWLVGRIGSDIFYTSSNDLTGTSLFDLDPFDLSNTSFVLTETDILAELDAFVDKSVLVRIGVLSDTHYYRNPDGTPHPLEQKNPVKYDLTANLGKMQSALDMFNDKGADFAVILGDMVEDHAGWPEGTEWPAFRGYIPDAALYSNLGDIGDLFDRYNFPIHLVIGNHDTGYGTTRTDLYNTSSYYAQENYDDGAYANRMDYTFDVNGVRFIAFDNVGQVPVSGLLQGYRWASFGTLEFITEELQKVSIGGIDEGMPVVLMSHARVDCLVENSCNQKVNLVDPSKYQWTPSNGGVNEFYLEAIGGGSPDIRHTSEYFNQFIWLDNLPLEVSTVGSLKVNSWDYGVNPEDGILFNTIYI